MARLQARTARGYNRIRGFFGRLWQSRCRARVIDNVEHYRRVLTSVHLNPVAAGITEDPASYVYSGHREILGLCSPHVIDRTATLRGFEGKGARDQADSYLRWVRSVAVARMLETPVSEFPLWKLANHVDEIAVASRHPSATTYDGRILAEEREEMDLADIASRLEDASGRSLIQLGPAFVPQMRFVVGSSSSRWRSPATVFADARSLLCSTNTETRSPSGSTKVSVANGVIPISCTK